LLDVFIGARVLPGKYPCPRSALLVTTVKIQDVTAAQAPAWSRSAWDICLWSDVDQAAARLLVTLEWGGVRYWHNRQGAGSKTGRTAQVLRRRNRLVDSLTAGRLQWDGRLDYAAVTSVDTPYAPVLNNRLLFTAVRRQWYARS